VAFATFYPRVELLFRLQARWVAAILLGVLTLASLAGRDWLGLAHGWATAAAGWGYVAMLRAGGAGEVLRGIGLRAGRPRVSGGGQEARRKTGRSAGGRSAQDEIESIDPLLEKIAKGGMGSLSEEERARLERARLALLRRQGAARPGPDL
jgi:hypothetical protein